MKSLVLFLVLTTSIITGLAQEKISIKAADGLEITGDLYQQGAALPGIVLFHQAMYSRGEYINTAKELNKLGYNCLAIDQRSGSGVNKVKNETHGRAKSKNLGTKYYDAYQDMEAALKFFYQKMGNKPVIILGSSYSAALVLKLGVDHQEMISKVIAFSPGEYIKGHNVASWANQLEVPLFVTSSKGEVEAVEKIVINADKNKVTHFKPKGKGIHGSRVLWKTTENNEEYWEALKDFLGRK